MFEQAHEVIFSFTPEGIITSLNPAFERVLGWTAGDWIGKHFMGLVPADLQPQASELFRRVLTERKIDLMRFTLLSKEGNRVALEVSVGERILNEKEVGFIGVARDITERLRAEHALRRSERQLAEAQAVAKLGSWEHDLITDTMWWSAEANRAFGFEARPTAISYDHFLQLIPTKSQQFVLDFRNALYVKGEHSAELELARISHGAATAAGELWKTGLIQREAGLGRWRERNLHTVVCSS